MTRFEIRVVPHTSLFIGGYAQALGGSDGDTASDARGLLLPGSAVKGALREAAVRLAQGAGRGREIVSALFGADGREGLLRFATLRAENAPGLTAADGTVRNHVSLERTTRQAAPQRLFQNRVTPARPGLDFRGILESREPLSDDALGLLLSAARITDQIGGGRGRGLGLVTVTLEPAAADEAVEAAREGATSLVLVLEAEEAVHLSGVKDPSNYVASKDYLDGSSVRGAVARALGGQPSDPDMELLFGGETPVVFGDGRPGGKGAIPAPMTVQERKAGGLPIDLAVELCADACGGRPAERPDDVRTARGTYALDGDNWFPVRLKRRTVTRTARDHSSGRGADGQLFSLEVLDPVIDSSEGEGTENLRFHVPVSGSPRQLDLVLRAARRGLTVGGDRSRGFGRLRLAEVVYETRIEPLKKRHAAWAEAAGRLGVPAPESTGVLLAVGPLAVSHQRLQAALRAEGLELREGVARRQTHGGWNARLHLPRTVSSHYMPGSTFIVARSDGGSALESLARLEERGIGPGRPDGWGRLVACHPIHLNRFQGGRKVSSLSATQRRAIDLAKEDLVTAAEELLEVYKVRPDRDDFGHSQLRNLGAVAAETESPAVVLNFIRYQMGRDNKKEGWSRDADGKPLGERFLDALGKDGVIAKALQEVGKEGENDPERMQIARMQLIRYFLGFVTRYMKYLEVKYPKPKKGDRS